MLIKSVRSRRACRATLLPAAVIMVGFAALLPAACGLDREGLDFNASPPDATVSDAPFRRSGSGGAAHAAGGSVGEGGAGAGGEGGLGGSQQGIGGAFGSGGFLAAGTGGAGTGTGGVAITGTGGI